MPLSFRFFTKPINIKHIEKFDVVKDMDFGEAMLKVMKPKQGLNYMLPSRKGGESKYLRAFLHVSGCGTIAILSDQQSDENWELDYRKLRK